MLIISYCVRYMRNTKNGEVIMNKEMYSHRGSKVEGKGIIKI